MPELPDWMRANVILGTDGADYIPVLLGPDGSMYAVLQGEYEGELRTVKLDDEGRMSAFVIDSVDAWGRMLSVGNAELAVRLGSSVVYERTGEVQFIENFGSGLSRWWTTVSGTLAAVELSPVSSASGGYSVKMTGGSDGLHGAWLYFRRGLLPQAKLGISVGFALPDSISSFEVRIRTYDGTTMRTATVRFDDADNDLDYKDSGGVWQRIAGVDTGSRLKGTYNYIKLVADFAGEVYTRCLFNQVLYDLSEHSIEASLNPNPSYIECLFTLYSRDGFNDVAYVDDVIFTDAET